MKSLLLLISICFISELSYSQQPARLTIAPSIFSINKVKDFTTDNLGNIYILTASNQVKKINNKGDSIAVYNDVKRYGKIYSIDVTNPLKVLVYFKDFSTIVILDRLLNVRATIELRKEDILQASAIATSYDNNIWLYDELDSKLKKIDESGTTLFTSSDFRQVFDSPPNPTSIFDRDGQLYLYDSAKGLLVFDYYGGLKNNLQLLHLLDLQVMDKNTITARDQSNIIIYKPASLQLTAYKVFEDQGQYKKINFKGDILYTLNKNDELQLFKVSK